MEREPASKERLRREAADWMARLRGPASDEDRAAFARWYAEPAQAAAYDRIKAGFESAGLLARSELARTRRPLGPQPTPRRRYALAAGLAVLLIVPAALLVGDPDFLFAPAEAETLFFTTTIGEIREIPLPDGTRMTLDTRTAVSVELTREERRVTLNEGRARFVVAQDARPFLVDAGRLRVSSREATFDVAVRERAASVQQIEGAVSVEPAGAGGDAAPATLQPGQIVTVSSSGDPLRPQRVSRSPSSWPEGMLEFDNTPLAGAVAEANLYARTQIVLADPSLSGLRVSGAFRAGDVNNFARSLAAAFGLRLEREGADRLVLYPRTSGSAPP